LIDLLLKGKDAPDLAKPQLSPGGREAESRKLFGELEPAGLTGKIIAPRYGGWSQALVKLSSKGLESFFPKVLFKPTLYLKGTKL